MKEQENYPEEQLNEIEVRNLSDKEFRGMIKSICNRIKKKRHRNHKKGPFRNKECNI